MAVDIDSLLRSRAEAFDQEQSAAPDILPALVASGCLAIGIPRDLGGAGGEVVDAIEAIAQVSASSLAAGFVFWGHRTFLEYALQSANEALRARYLPDLLAGTIAGATGLSNAMKFLSGLEGLNIVATPSAGGYRVDGKLPWVTNLRPEGFVVAAALAVPDGRVLVGAIRSDAEGVERSPDLNLMAMRASNTAAVALRDVVLAESDVLTDEACQWLPRVRPAFLGLQCGLSIGLARRSLHEARAACGAGRHVLHEPIDRARADLQSAVNQLYAGLRSGSFITHAAPLFALRIKLAELADEAVGFELQAAGGRAYLVEDGAGVQRRWREAAFVPLITPSLVQLKMALATQAAEKAA
jgi:alkylation response protein AidB-like acyl-CoA dehydrogenase